MQQANTPVRVKSAMVVGEAFLSEHSPMTDRLRVLPHLMYLIFQKNKTKSSHTDDGYAQKGG